MARVIIKSSMCSAAQMLRRHNSDDGAGLDQVPIGDPHTSVACVLGIVDGSAALEAQVEF